MRRALVAAVLAAAVGSLAQEGLDEVYEAPEVEPSVLEQHEAATHEAGRQYDFVKDEVAAVSARPMQSHPQSAYDGLDPVPTPLTSARPICDCRAELASPRRARAAQCTRRWSS